MHIGIDFGAKMAGTTAVCYVQNEKMIIQSSKKNNDADRFIKEVIENIKPTKIFIDAPLSLPLAYFNKGSDFHFRQCDKETSAMSPMFLGGLTARAMSIKAHFSEIEFYESYPKMVCIELGLNKYYKKDINNFLPDFYNTLPHTFENAPVNWHEVDAVFAYMVGLRLMYNKAICVGNKEEGLIYY